MLSLHNIDFQYYYNYGVSGIIKCKTHRSYQNFFSEHKSLLRSLFVCQSSQVNSNPMICNSSKGNYIIMSIIYDSEFASILLPSGKQPGTCLQLLHFSELTLQARSIYAHTLLSSYEKYYSICSYERYYCILICRGKFIDRIQTPEYQQSLSTITASSRFCSIGAGSVLPKHLQEQVDFQTLCRQL